MIGSLRGTLVDIGVDGTCLIEVGGVGYEAFVPDRTRVGLRLGQDWQAAVHTHVREEAITLFAFDEASDRLAFRTLIGVSSVGPKLALAILGRLSARDLAVAIARKDATVFRGIPGVGKRTVERILVDLHDKFPAALMEGAGVEGSGIEGSRMGSSISPGMASVTVASEPWRNVLSILVGLGYKPPEAEGVVARLEAAGAGNDTENFDVQQMLRRALRELAQ